MDNRPAVLYHGTAGQYGQVIYNEKNLRPRIGMVRPEIFKFGEIPFEADIATGMTNSTPTWGPRGDPQVIYLSDLFAITYALHAPRGGSHIILCEVPMESWVFGETRQSPHLRREVITCWAIADMHWYWRKVLNHSLWNDYQPDYSTNGAHKRGDKLALPSGAPKINDFTWQDSYREMGSLGVATLSRGLRVRRILQIDLEKVPHSTIMNWDSIIPTRNLDLATQGEIRSLHQDLFDNPPPGSKVWELEKLRNAEMDLNEDLIGKVPPELYKGYGHGESPSTFPLEGVYVPDA